MKTPASQVAAFRKLLHRALFLDHAEEGLFERIPDAVLDNIFSHNFNGSIALAERILLNRYSEIDRVDRQRLEMEKQGIKNLLRAARTISRALVDQTPVLFITDNDNDGSLAQAILIEFLKALPRDARELVHIEYAQPIGKSRGLTYEIVEKAVESRGWSDDMQFLIVTADNGINNRTEQHRIQERWMKAPLIVTDHHLPKEGDVVEENGRTLIFNPKHEPTEYFKKKNISGANTLGVLLKQTLKDYQISIAPPGEEGVISTQQGLAMANMEEIGLWANLLDYANSDIADMPLRPYVVEKALGLRPLLNVSNSMSNLITATFSEEDINRVLALSAEESVRVGEEGLSDSWLRERLADIRSLNILSHKLLNLYHETRYSEHAYTEKDFYTELARAIASPDHTYHSINPNYIEQLRPVIFNLSAIDNKDIFHTMLSDSMVRVFDELRNQESQILKGLRTVLLLRQDRRPFSTINYPIDPVITRLFNRRLLGKVYNESNNGFILTLDKVDQHEARGSMRSQYPVSDLLEGKEAIEQKLGIEVSFQGHEMAAGFFIKSLKGNLSEATISSFNAWMDSRVAVAKAAESLNLIPTVEIDFASVGLINKINTLIRSNLAGMRDIPSILRFSPNKNEEVWVTDADTTEQISLTEVVARRKFGYQAIRTDFHGGSIVVPVELLRAIIDSNYEKALRLSYMDEGVFMASQIVDPEKLPRLTEVKGGRADFKALADYYRKTFKDSNFMDLTREDFRTSPFFRFNRYGESEFFQWENLMITMLDTAGADVLAVIDTEGTGLGKAPKCFNIGGTNITINPDSGHTQARAEFEDHYFQDETGTEYHLTSEQLASLVPMGDSELLDPATSVQLTKLTLEDGVQVNDRRLFLGSVRELEKVTNLKFDHDNAVWNRAIEGFAFAFIVNNSDFAVTPELEDLTGISNGMVNSLGHSASRTDQLLTDYYRNLKNPEGNPARIIFQAHNMPYDKGIISTNFQKFNDLMGEHMTSDTAKLSRKAKLAYDDTPVSSFVDIEGIPAKAYFYDSPYSNYSMSTFLDRIERGKGGVFPDITANLLIRYNPESERFSLIDRKANREVMIDASLSDFRTRRLVGNLPNNAVKYSVEALSTRAMIRNIILLDHQRPTRVPLQPNERPFRAALDLFQENYHFDSTLDTNISNFFSSLSKTSQGHALASAVNMREFGERFLTQNKAIQAKFHDGWIYQKVLKHFEPSASSLRVPQMTIENVNYFSDVPVKKIKQVFRDVIRFKRHFNVEHALVHEQHNNIRQRSEDGQGLSDTAYESILPQLLGMMKFYNPYYQSVRPAVKEMIESNIKGSLIQTMVGDEFSNELPRDSYSVAQMLAFRRTDKTERVEKAQKMVRGKTGEIDPIKFRLSTGILLPGSAVYGRPKRHLSQEEVHAVSEKLEFVLINEQLKESIIGSNTLARSQGCHLAAFANANDVRASQIRDELLELFDNIEFNRKDGAIKKISEMMKEVAEGGEVVIPARLKVDDTMMEAARNMRAGFEVIFSKLGSDAWSERMDELVVELEGLHQKTLEDQVKEEKKAEKAREKRAQTVELLEMEDEAVRRENFLPQVDIQRHAPFKFLLDVAGVSACFAYLRKQEDDMKMAANTWSNLAGIDLPELPPITVVRNKGP